MKDQAQLFVENKKLTALLFLGSLGLFVAGLSCVFRSMAIVEQRQGVHISDLVHSLLPPPVDLSNWIFMVMYSVSVYAIIHVVKRGFFTASMVFFAATFLSLLRCVSMLLVPLEPPVSMVSLDDPLLRFFNPNNIVFSKDLFFSGHTASMFFFYFVVNDKRIKPYLLVLSIFIITAISLQRVHYTIDIIGGIIAAYASYRFSVYLRKIFWNPCHLHLVQEAPAIRQNAKAIRKRSLEKNNP